MAWTDRIIEAAYTSPGGVRTVFDYEDVSRSVDKKTTAFDSPDADGTYVQDLGHTGRKYPLRLIFWGTDYDIEAEALEASLLERGTGKLEHPFYGVVDVVPFGTINRRDDLKTAANQAIIEVTFWETIDLIYPTSQRDAASDVLGAVAGFNSTAADQFASKTSLVTAIEDATFANDFNRLLGSAQGVLKPLADTNDAVGRQFNAIYDSIGRGIRVLIADPIALASQTLQLIQTPARLAGTIGARLDGYKNLATDLTSTAGISTATSVKDRNKFQARDLFATSYVTGAILSAVNSEFETKVEALQAADDIIDQFIDVVTWRDGGYDSLRASPLEATTETVDTGETYQRLQEAVALAAGFLVEISFTLKQERTIILDRDRTIIDLAAEIYGDVDAKLDFLINSNKLTGSEILELPRGRKIVYYV